MATQNRRLRVVPTAPPVAIPPSVSRLLGLADAELAAAVDATGGAERFQHAHMAALRSAAALVELRGRPGPRTGARTVWEMLARVEPGLGPWSGYFASGAALRSDVESGVVITVDQARAAELLASAEDFRDEVGLIIDPAAGFSLPLSLAAVS